MNKPKYKRFYYTEEHIEWLKENVYGIRHKELAKRFNEHFCTNLTTRKIKRVLMSRGIKNGLNQSDLTKEMKQFVFDNYEGISNQELADKLNAKFGTNFKATKFADFKWANGLKSGYRFEVENLRKKQQLEETLRQDGYTYIKVNDEWYAKQRYVYEKYKGKIPEGYVIIFKDGNTQNCEIDNLMLADKKLLSRVASLITDDKDLNETIILNGRLQIKIEELGGSSNE